MKRIINKVKAMLRSFKKKTVFFFKKKKAEYMCIHYKPYGGGINPTESAEENLNKIYPDNGKLADKSGFNIKEPTLDLSIIIAMYNAEKYIGECINSVLNQNPKCDFEIIIVNDGSTDGSKEAVKPYLEDKRIKLFDQDNKGQSVARNFAIENSSGKYLMMLDADDVLTMGSIDHLMDLAKKTGAEITEGVVERFYNKFDYKTKKKDKVKVYSGKKKEKYILTSTGFSVAKVYRRELWENCRYPEGYIFEDIITKFVLRPLANRIAVSSRVVYGYRFTPNSSTHGTKTLKWLDSVYVLPKIFEICENNRTKSGRVFYYLSLCHIGLLNNTTLSRHDEEVKKAAFAVMQKQVLSIDKFRPKHMPKILRALKDVIRCGDLKGWEFISENIIKYGLAKKYRENN